MNDIIIFIMLLNIDECLYGIVYTKTEIKH